MKNFLSLKLPQPLMQSLERMNFKAPTPIQEQAIPPALEGNDILGTAQTGTGKTAAFGIPLVAQLMINPQGSALVMTPTRELAVQVMKALQELLGRQSRINTALLIGGEAMPKQLKQLRARPRLIVGTPGRINDHLARHTLKLADATFLILDETDRMMDMGFTPQIEKIIKHMPKERQTLLFSATMPKNIIGIAEKYLHNPVRISVGSTSAPVDKIKQEILHTSEKEKYPELVSQLQKREGSIIVFVKTKWGAEKMAKKLRDENQTTSAIHGDLRQNKRDRVINAFRNRKNRILVATDIAARGLDIPHIEHVINYDLPQCPEDYIHRIGRTARAGAEGSALCFVTPGDRSKWGAINRLINPNAKPETYPRSSSKKKHGSTSRPFSRFKKSGAHPSSRSKKPYGGKKGSTQPSRKNTGARPMRGKV